MGVDGFEAAEAPVGTTQEAPVGTTQEAPVGIAQAVEDLSLSETKENGKLSSEPAVSEPIKFGSHGDEPVKVEEAVPKVPETDLRKEAVAEWPAPKKIHSFYFVKYRSYEDQKLREKYDMVDEEIRRKNQARIHILDLLKAKRSDRFQVISQLKLLTSEDKQFRATIGVKRKEIEPLHQALGQLRGERGSSLCSSEEELNALIGSLNYQIEHESIPLTEEKKLLREIKQLEQTREKVVANAAMRMKIQDDLGKKETIQGQVKLFGENLDGVRKNHQILRSKIKLLEEELRAIDSAINDLQEELATIVEQRDKAFETLHQVRKLRDEGNANFYKNRMLLNKARDLASKRDVKALEELCHAEVEKFMSLWNDTKSFRDDYEKRHLSSFDYRQLSRDGRMRNPGEKTLFVIEAPAPVQTVTVQKTTPKQPPKEEVKEEVKKEAKEQVTEKEQATEKEQVTETPQTESLPTSKKAKGEAKKASIESSRIAASEELDDDFFVPESHVKVEIDEETLKEMKKQEEKEKAKQAMERKRKKEEKAAKKAASRAENEAKKKQKDLEKKEKKKNAASAPDSNLEESSDVVSEVAEADTDMSSEAPVPSKKKEDKGSNAMRYRGRSRGVKSVPKALVKRKKGTNYWLWLAPAVVVALILLVLGYLYAI